MNNIKKVFKRASFWLFELGQIFGLFIVPVHYYVPLASTRELRRTRDRWNKPIDLSPLCIDTAVQVKNLCTLVEPFEPEYRGNARYLEGVNNRAGPGFGYIEAQALHGFIRSTKPRRIIEIGSGVSTWCMLGALSLNENETGMRSEVCCIEPYPSQFLRSLPVKLKMARIEDVDLSFFSLLESGDLLFIDTSHAVRCCGDVARIYLEILYRLKPGVLIHIHDITFPFMFPRDVEQVYTQSMEAALLFATLANSTRFETLLSLSWLHYENPSALRKVFPDYDPQPNLGGLPGNDVQLFGEKRHFPSSTFIRVVSH